MTKLEVQGVSKTFAKSRLERTEALRDVNLTVEAGEFVSLVGASGCGKTTLLRIIDGLIEPSKGTVLLDGRLVTRPGVDRGFVFQGDSLFPWRSVFGNVIFGRELRGESRDSLRRKAGDMLNLVGIAEFENHYPHEISGGMRQRVNLARALAVDPDVLLMDEPFAALDHQTREIMQSELLKICAQARKTVIFVTHQIDEAVYLANRVVVMTARPGRIREEVAIDMPYPRPLDIKHSPEFGGLCSQIWQMIEEEVRSGLVLDSVPRRQNLPRVASK